MKRVVVIGGDGVGNEVISATVTVLNAVTNDIEFTYGDIGMSQYAKTKEYLSRETMDLITDSDSILLGAIDHPINNPRYRSPLSMLRRQLDLFMSMRPIYRLAHEKGMMDLNVFVIREGFDGTNAWTEIDDSEGVTLQKHMTANSERKICRMCRNICETLGNKRVALVHNLRMFPKSHGMLKNTFYEEMKGTTMKTEDVHLYDLSKKLVDEPDSVDVLLCTNAYGGLVESFISALCGRNLTLPMAAVGEHCGIFYPAHGPLSRLAGKNIVNPTASILSAALMLDFLKMHKEAETIRDAVRTAVKRGYRTKDLDGDMTTNDFADKVAELCNNPF